MNPRVSFVNLLIFVWFLLYLSRAFFLLWVFWQIFIHFLIVTFLVLLMHRDILNSEHPSVGRLILFVMWKGNRRRLLNQKVSELVHRIEVIKFIVLCVLSGRSCCIRGSFLVRNTLLHCGRVLEQILPFFGFIREFRVRRLQLFRLRSLVFYYVRFGRRFW